MQRHDDRRDEEVLRGHPMGPWVEHPVAREPARESEPREVQRVPVMSWLVAVGHVVVRRLRGAPSSAMVRLHPKS